MPNPLDRHLEALRAAEPRPPAVDRAVAALRRPPKARLLPLAAGVAVLSALLLWPRPGSGVAWAQIADAPRPDRYILHRSTIRNGRPEPWITIWNDATVGARRMREVSTLGRPIFPQETAHSRAGRYVRRYLDYATFTRHTTPLPKRDPYFFETEMLVRGQGFKEVRVERDVETRVGRADRYTVERELMESGLGVPKGATAKDRLVAFVAPGTKRILGWDSSYGGARWHVEYETTVEYPDRIPPSVFAVRPPAGVRLYDLDAIRAAAAKPARGPLRLVVQDANRRVWLFWRDGASATILGTAQGERVWALEDYNGMGAYGWRSPYRAVGARLPRQVSRVDVRLGSRTLRNVPVLGIDNLETVAKALRMSPLHGSSSPEQTLILGR